MGVAMDVRFMPHNTHLEDPASFADLDPNLRQLKRQVWVHRSSLLDLLPVETPGIYTLGGGRQIGKTTLAKQWMDALLNAGIEAEKAGEYGLGFSVVAREIRRLADQTAVSSYDIEKMVKEMQSAVSSGVMEMDKFTKEVRQGVENANKIKDHLENIIEQVQAMPPLFDEVSGGMAGQAQGAQQISESMVQLSSAAQQAAESLQEFNEATEQLNASAQDLQQEISIFKVSNE